MNKSRLHSRACRQKKREREKTIAQLAGVMQYGALGHGSTPEQIFQDAKSFSGEFNRRLLAMANDGPIVEVKSQ